MLFLIGWFEKPETQTIAKEIHHIVVIMILRRTLCHTFNF